MQIKILEITPGETLSIRHQVMWPDRSLEYVMLPNDDQGKHYGLFIDNQLISVISLFIVNQEAQFRKFATLSEHQGQGHGSTLLNYIMQLAAEQDLRRIWCNARVDKSGYYEKFGLKPTKETFNKGGIAYVIMEKIIG